MALRPTPSLRCPGPWSPVCDLLNRVTYSLLRQKHYGEHAFLIYTQTRIVYFKKSDFFFVRVLLRLGFRQISPSNRWGENLDHHPTLTSTLGGLNPENSEDRRFLEKHSF